MQVVAWKTRAMFDRYNIVSQGDLKLFKARMNAHVEAIEGGCAPLSHTNHSTNRGSGPSEEKEGKRLSRSN